MTNLERMTSSGCPMGEEDSSSVKRQWDRDEYRFIRWEAVMRLRTPRSK